MTVHLPADMASTAVGDFMRLLTPWNRDLKAPLFTVYDGNRGTLSESPRLRVLAETDWVCPHFCSPDALGDVSW
jgi:molybdopterin-synthase adenylyltransferase